MIHIPIKCWISSSVISLALLLSALSAVSCIQKSNDYQVTDKDIAVASITLNYTNLEIAVGGSQALFATIKPDNATNKAISWDTDDAHIATIDNNGMITAKAAGSTVVSAMARDGSGTNAICYVTVTNSSSSGGGGDNTGSSAIGWELNPDSIMGGQNKLNPNKPDANYNPSPYNQYGAILSNSTTSEILTHFREFKVDVNTESHYTFRIVNYKSDIVDFETWYPTDCSISHNNGYASFNISGKEIKYYLTPASGRIVVIPFIHLKDEYKTSKRFEVLIEVIEENYKGSYSEKHGFYYLVFDEYNHYAQNFGYYYPAKGSAELGTFVDCNDYILCHELLPQVRYDNGPILMEWDFQADKWKLTAEGESRGYSVYKFSFRVNKLIYNKNGKDTQDSFWPYLSIFEAGQVIYPYPIPLGSAKEGGIDWLPEYNLSFMSITTTKVAGYELEVIYNGTSLFKTTGEIKILPSGKKAHPYHHPDGSWWN